MEFEGAAKARDFDTGVRKSPLDFRALFGREIHFDTVGVGRAQFDTPVPEFTAPLENRGYVPISSNVIGYDTQFHAMSFIAWVGEVKLRSVLSQSSSRILSRKESFVLSFVVSLRVILFLGSIENSIKNADQARDKGKRRSLRRRFHHGESCDTKTKPSRKLSLNSIFRLVKQRAPRPARCLVD